MNSKNESSQRKFDEFLNRLASAILAWQYVEHNLFLIFTFLVGKGRTKDSFPKTISAVFHSVVNLNIRLKMIDAAAEVTLENDPNLSEWHIFSKRVSKLAKRRNALVHFGLIRGTGRTGSVKWSLAPSIFDVRERSGLQYDVKQIAEWHTMFNELGNDLAKFLDKLPLKH